MYNAELFSEVSQQKKVQESCLPPEVTRESRNACTGVSVTQLKRSVYWSGEAANS